MQSSAIGLADVVWRYVVATHQCEHAPVQFSRHALTNPRVVCNCADSIAYIYLNTVDTNHVFVFGIAILCATDMMCLCRVDS